MTKLKHTSSPSEKLSTAEYNVLFNKEDFFQQVIDSIEDYAVFTTDVDGNIGSWNTGAQRLLYYNEKEIIGQNASIFFTPEDIMLKAHEKELSTAIRDGRAKDERWHVRKDRSRLWGSGLVFPLKDDDDKIIGFTKIMRDLTFRKLVEEEKSSLHSREQRVFAQVEAERKRLQSLFTQAPALIAILKGDDFIVELFNPLFRKLLGNRSVIGKPMRKAWPELRKQGMFELIENVFKTGKSEFRYEYLVRIDRRNNGVLEDAYFNFVFAPSKNEHEIVDGVLVFGFEVTDQVVSRQRLKISEDRLQLAQKTGRVGTFEWDLRSGKMLWTPELLSLYGIETSTVDENGYEWQKFLHPDDIDRVQKEARHCAKTGESFNSEFRIIWPDQSVHYLSVRAQIIKNTKGKPERMVGVNIDITERKTIEKNLEFLTEASKLLSSSLDYQTTLNNVAMLAVPEIADWCTVDLINKKNELEQVTIAHKDPQKIAWAKELRSENPPNMNDTTGVAQVIRTGKSLLYPHITDEMLTAAAKSKKQLKLMREIGFTSAMIVPICREKKCIGAITFVTTETRRRYNETDLAMAEELASRASLAIENARLYKGSQDAIALRDDFISVASHELKTPITSVKMFTHVLTQHSQQIGDKKAVSHLTKMDKQINKLTELIYNLLDISKIQAGRIEFKKKVFDFDNLIAETVDMFESYGHKHKIEVKGKTGKMVYGDDDRISQVISNLIANAIKYSPRAEHVVVKLSSTDNHVKVKVTDFGIGIPKEHLERIFERFYRVYDETDKTFPGLGIGLYIASEIIRRHNGTFGVESDIGKGSTFYFTLPVQ